MPYPPDMSIGERIRDARARLRMSQADLGKAVNVAQTTISKWEKGGSEPSREEAGRLATALHVDVIDLWGMDTDEDGRKVRLMGYLGAGQAIERAEGDPPLELVSAPVGVPHGAECAVVRGRSMMNTYYPGSVVIWWTWFPDPIECIGIPCMVELTEGGHLLKIVERGSRRGLWNLVSVNAAYETLRDVPLRGAAPIEATFRRPWW